MDTLVELAKAGEGFIDAILASIFGWVVLDPPELIVDEKILGGLFPFETLLLTFKKNLAMSDVFLLQVGAVIISELVTIFVSSRLFFSGVDVESLAIRKCDTGIVLVQTDPDLEMLGLLVESFFDNQVASLPWGSLEKSEVKKIRVLDPSASDLDDGEEYLTCCPYQFGLFCGNCPYRFICHIALPKRELTAAA